MLGMLRLRSVADGSRPRFALQEGCNERARARSERRMGSVGGGTASCRELFGLQSDDGWTREWRKRGKRGSF